jgi:hypothetical protein
MHKTERQSQVWSRDVGRMIQIGSSNMLIEILIIFP